MEIGTSTLTGALRISLQVLVNRRRPLLEIYQQLHNRMAPEEEVGPIGDKSGERIKFRHQEIFVTLSIANIGSLRAENVSFVVSGSFKRDTIGGLDRPIGKLLDATFAQIPPGQAFQITRLDDHELYNYEPEPGSTTAYRQAGIRMDKLIIDVHYDGPSTILNRLLRFRRRLIGKKQYQTHFEFDPQTVVGDLPPVEYQ